VLPEEVLRRDEPQHAVAQKLQPFVAAGAALVLVGVGAVVQRLLQQSPPAEPVAQLFLQ
jgi:hypothetical protein